MRKKKNLKTSSGNKEKNLFKRIFKLYHYNRNNLFTEKICFLLQMSSSLLLRRVIQQCSSVRLISTRFNSSSVENKNTNESASIDSQFKTKIDDFVKSNKIAIFIKGEPDAPRRIKVFFFFD
jgi:hypothetical protein